MDRTIAVSFEEDNIKVVHASSKGNIFSIENSETIAYDAFDNYLKRAKASEFIVTYDFKDSYHGILSIPILKPKYQKKIVESELKKISKINNISFTYVPLGERVIDKRKVLEVFYFAVNSELIQDVVGKFYNHNKVVRAVYPTVFSAASLIESGTPEEANMGIFSNGTEKVIFFTKDRSVYFIRNYDSQDAELSDFDIQNMNMTISYCFQNIRIEPSSVMLLGNLSESCNINTLTTAPLASLRKSDNIKCDNEVFNMYYLPIASFFAPTSSSILSNDFKKVNSFISYMGYASKAFAILAIVCLGLLMYYSKNIDDKKTRLREAMMDRHTTEDLYSEYGKRADSQKHIKLLTNFLNRPSPDLQNLLAMLAVIRAKDLKFHLIEASSKDGKTYSVLIGGKSYVDTYYSMQSSFDEVIAALKEKKDISVKEKTIDLSNKKFTIKLHYQKTG